MDLSGLKWPIIIVVVVAVGWLFTSGGVDWMISQSTKATVGTDAAKDEFDEAMLSRIGGYLMFQWRYAKAAECFNKARERYGESGKNYWYNTYRLVRCYERMQEYATSVQILDYLISSGASQLDKRVPENDNLALTKNKLLETHELGEIQ